MSVHAFKWKRIVWIFTAALALLAGLLPATRGASGAALPVGQVDSLSSGMGGAVSDLRAGLQQVITPTITSEAEEATATPPPADPGRPLIVVESYQTGVETVDAGSEFNLQVRIKNIGSRMAFNVVATFTPGDFVPRVSGGLLATTEIDPGERKKFNQPLTASLDLMGKRFGTVVMTLTYNDVDGAAFSSTFNLSVAVTPLRYSGATATPTPTPTGLPSLRPQILITAYQTDQPVLQPGFRFKLSLSIENLGNSDARRVTMIIGGGSGSSGGLPGTPDVGGVSGGSGDFGNFAPVAASNVQYLGDLPLGQVLQTQAELIVNASTNPGAYPMKISFTYVDAKGSVFNDDQVVTLLVYSPPQVDVSFYRPPDPLFVGQQGQLPLQVVNLGRKSAILGTMKVSAVNGQLSNNSVLIGALDVGGYYTLDAMLIPDLPGPLELAVTIDYTDDFNQPQVINRTVTVDVQEMFMPEPEIPGGEGIPGDGGLPLPEQPETFWQKVLRFLRGLFGLDSAPSQPVPGEILPGEVPPGESPAEQPPARPPIKG